VLDIGTGGADIPVALLERARRRGRGLTVIAVDERPEILAAALQADPMLATVDGLRLEVGDGLSLAFPDRSFDVAHTSLLLHHLGPASVVALLREMGRIARLGIVVNDLDRSRVGWIGAWLLGHLLTTNRYTRNDAPLSVRRAYRPSEVKELMTAAGLRPVRIHRGAALQRYAIAAIVAPSVDALAPLDAVDGGG